jgi:beta-glucosidase
MSGLSRQFPKKFLWGASTAAHQVEGGTHNQWSVWELENAHSLAAQAPYQYGDLDAWSDVAASAKRADNYVSGKACDHYRRYKEDFDLLEKLNLTAFRFSLEWSRLEPREGEWDAGEVEHYRRYLEELARRGITPIVTLVHFTLPVWFSEKGGFERRGNLPYFERYVEKVMSELGKHMKYIITINEPEVYADMSYRRGEWPPNLTSRLKAQQVVEHMISAHKKAARVIHAMNRRFKVSMAYSLAHIYPGDDAWLTRVSAAKAKWLRHYVLRRTYKANDFIGLNYYHTDRYYGSRVHNPDQRTNDLGWDMHPADIRHVIMDLHERYKKPIMITENGLADAADEHRSWWLLQTVGAIGEAIGEGANVIGYLHWSLLDNFEWDKGFWPRFGLVAVNYETMERTVKPSARVYARIVKKMGNT